MTDQTARHTARAQEEASRAPAAASEQAAAPAPSTALEREHAETKDRLLRALAEMENLRKRTDREIADSRLYSLTSFARDLLVVADNMRRALDAVAPELRSSAEGGVKALIEGVELTERELLKALETGDVDAVVWVKPVVLWVVLIAAPPGCVIVTQTRCQDIDARA